MLPNKRKTFSILGSRPLKLNPLYGKNTFPKVKDELFVHKISM
jgi:hypothetical protein